MIDMLGHPLKKGQTVLTKAFYSPAMDTIATVLKVNKKTIVVELKKRVWDFSSNNPTISEVNQEMKRTADSVLVIDQQLEYNQNTFPEYTI